MLDTKRKNNKTNYDKKALTFPIVDQTVKKFVKDQKTKTIKPKVISIHIKWNEFYEKLRQ